MGGKGRRRGRGRRRGSWFRRNSYMPNMPFSSGKEMALAGLLGIGTFGLIHYGAKFAGTLHPLAGAGVGLALGAAAAFGADKVFSNDAYAKATAVAGIISLIVTAGKALMGMFNKGAAGFGTVSFENTRGNWIAHPSPLSAFYQAQAGLGSPFYQAQAGLGSPFYQAQAGFGGPFIQAKAGYGEYFATPMQGTGEYFATDGSVSPVSDFGEYVAQNLQVEGYGDYEVMPSYTPGADGFGYVNDGVNPGANMDNEFNIIEAAAGLGSNVTAESDYIPTGFKGQVGDQESDKYAGVFDVGGPNGVFG